VACECDVLCWLTKLVNTAVVQQNGAMEPAEHLGTLHAELFLRRHSYRVLSSHRRSRLGAKEWHPCMQPSSRSSPRGKNSGRYGPHTSLHSAATQIPFPLPNVLENEPNRARQIRLSELATSSPAAARVGVAARAAHSPAEPP
jgi:hypothetical protein